jgi:hypothetical protein
MPFMQAILSACVPTKQSSNNKGKKDNNKDHGAP